VQQLAEWELRRHLQRDWLRYVAHHEGPRGLTFARVSVVVLTGLVPASLRLLRGRPRAALDQLALAAQVLR